MTGEYPGGHGIGQQPEQFGVPGDQPHQVGPRPPIDALREQLAREDRARNPQTPEEWYIHAVESMGAIGEIERSRHGGNETQDYRTFPIRVHGGTGLYTDTPQDNYEVRVQRDAEINFDEDENVSLSDLLALGGDEAIEAVIKDAQGKQADSPEFIWRDHRAQVVTVQRHNTELPLSSLDPEELADH